jgi:hypothetical protein
MKLRIFLVAAVMGLTASAVCVAAESSSAAKAKSGICSSANPPANWLVTDGTNTEYPGIIAGQTHMQLHLHSHANAPDEWQIEFANVPASKAPPPGAAVMHLIKVCWKDSLEKAPTPYLPPAKPIAINPYLMYAYNNILTQQSNYYIATGYLDGEPTMIVLTLNEPTAQTGTKMGFTLVLVKLDERTTPPSAKQGGVLHGQEN